MNAIDFVIEVAHFAQRRIIVRVEFPLTCDNNAPLQGCLSRSEAGPYCRALVYFAKATGRSTCDRKFNHENWILWVKEAHFQFELNLLY